MDSARVAFLICTAITPNSTEVLLQLAHTCFIAGEYCCTKENLDKISKIEPNKLLHMVHRKEDFKNGRSDIVSEEHFIQCSSLKMEKGKTFRPHRHIWKERTRKIIK